ncbi:class I SAM-dependent methyltransferase [Pseudohaliea rubra]|uniref:Methyltransferase n=1 Tax=Pseudohaliea rubra DSM 19751 TaxID=1265313 RepID=A0A095VNV1_9GAMM|nr:class I SAM-dependent methyltransferase [Pseudohaliea rubra]KGE03112.1 Methyltransferase [Pseudohaliea rubra DSM 19751]
MSNEEQIAYWNGDAGRKWAEKDDMMAAMLGPIARALLEHCDPAGASSVLDIGCGGGSETLMLAERLRAGSRVLGVDVSAPLLAVAAQRLAEAGELPVAMDFLQADASEYPFEAGSWDFLFSRFGVMFFDEPVGAFSNLHRALAPGGTMAFCCWQRLQDNPWVALPLKAALEHLPPPPAPEPHAPGPFAFADRERLARILSEAGFTAVTIEHRDVTMGWGSGGDLAQTTREMLNIGPVGRLLAEENEAVRQRVYDSAANALTAYFSDGRISLPGATWFVTARRGD